MTEPLPAEFQKHCICKSISTWGATRLVCSLPRAETVSSGRARLVTLFGQVADATRGSRRFGKVHSFSSLLFFWRELQYKCPVIGYLPLCTKSADLSSAMARPAGSSQASIKAKVKIFCINIFLVRPPHNRNCYCVLRTCSLQRLAERPVPNETPHVHPFADCNTLEMTLVLTWNQPDDTTVPGLHTRSAGDRGNTDAAYDCDAWAYASVLIW